MGAECYCGTLKCLIGGMKSEQRFNFRHTPDVSICSLGGVLPGTELAFQRLERPGHGLRAQIEVGAVPGGNTGPENDGLG